MVNGKSWGVDAGGRYGDYEKNKGKEYELKEDFYFNPERLTKHVKRCKFIILTPGLRDKQIK